MTSPQGGAAPDAAERGDGHVQLPRLGRDPEPVAAVTEPGHPVYARLFLPIAVSGSAAPAYLPWTPAAAAVGLPLTATTTWDELTAPSRHPDPRWELPRGTMDDSTAHAIVQAAGRAGVPAHAPASFVVWEGYPGELTDDDLASSRRLPATGETYLHDGSFLLCERPLEWILSRTDTTWRHVPVAFWPQDRSFVVATCLYQDSLYVSCDDTLLAALRAAGLDVLPIERNLPLPSRGD
jgi:hypothetical protein